MLTAGTAFLGLFAAGLVSLLAGVGLTRANWRRDLPPYGRGTRITDVIAHPERYATGVRVPTIRILNLLGVLLLFGAAGVALYEVARTMGAGR